MRRNRLLWLMAIASLLCPALAVAQDGGHDDQPVGLTQPEARTSPAEASPRARDPGRANRSANGRWAPGQVLPSSAPATVIDDYAAYHLRRPPRGYVWLRCDGDFILTNAAGLIFEVIPDGGR